MKFFARRAFCAFGFFIHLTVNASANTGDSVALSPRGVQIAASLEEMSEPELVLLLDSLSSQGAAEAALVSLINRRIYLLRSEAPKNSFGGFSIYPANPFYGVWDAKHIFPYGDSLYKSDTLTQLDLSPVVSGEFTFPFRGRITSPYGWRDSSFHRGVDIDLNRGDTVVSAFSGMVRFAARCGGYGNVVVVRHYNGLETVYAHLWKIKVKPGDLVVHGQLLGLGGSTGHSTGTHLHFETRFRGVAIDPAYLINYATGQLVAEKIAVVRTRQGYAVRPQGQDYHTVGRGENLTKISNHYGITVKQLRHYNGWSGKVRLKTGQSVRIAPPEITAARF